MRAEPLSEASRSAQVSFFMASTASAGQGLSNAASYWPASRAGKGLGPTLTIEDDSIVIGRPANFLEYANYFVLIVRADPQRIKIAGARVPLSFIRERDIDLLDIRMW